MAKHPVPLRFVSSFNLNENNSFCGYFLPTDVLALDVHRMAFITLCATATAVAVAAAAVKHNVQNETIDHKFYFVPTPYVISLSSSDVHRSDV